MQCARDPDVETELRCGKCETPICPRCMVQTPVGARCRDCANLRRPVQYTVPPLLLARAAGAAIGLAIVVGVAAGYALPHLLRQLSFLALFLGAGYGWLAALAVSRSAKLRRGMALQAAAALSGVLVYVIYNAIAGVALLPRNDLTGYLFVVCAAAVGWSSLR
jgi:hypothetical protein